MDVAGGTGSGCLSRPGDRRSHGGASGHCPAIPSIFFRHLCSGCGKHRGYSAVLKGKQNAVLSGGGSRIQKTAYCPADGGFHADADGGWKDVTVTTYREGDSNGIAALAFYKCLGFSEGKLTEEFGCPVQEFVLKR